jgi:molybdopterin-guanine dinucleotide biosynthesis protein A
MGSDKALAEIDGQPMAIRVAEAVAKVCGAVSLVGDPARYAVLGLPVVADHFPGLGPLAGIEAALSATDAEWNLIVACDMPALDETTLELLFAAGGDCALPEYENGQLEPLCAVYNRRCHAVVLNALESGVRRVTDALRSAALPSAHSAALPSARSAALPSAHSAALPFALRYVRVHHSEPFANLNTPAELRAYEKRRSRGATHG